LGIVLRQSLKNTLVIYLGFLIGGINTMVLYTQFLKKDYYGLATIVFSASNLIMPFIALGIHFTIVKFFSGYQNKKEKDKFLSTILFLPLLTAIPIGFFWDFFHYKIVEYVAKSGNEFNLIIENYTVNIYIIAICCAYYEVFYSWAKVQMQSVFGNVLKELYNRVAIMVFLFAVYFELITKQQFLVCMTGAYILRTILMMLYAFKLYMPKFSFSLPKNFKEVLRYTFYIILAGSAGAIVLDVDKVMIPSKDGLATVAIYGVAVFMGSFIEAPSRAMTQILQPLTSQSLNKNDFKETESLYKKSSINLLLVGGLFFVLINANVAELYSLLPRGYSDGVFVVLMISSAKLMIMLLGSNGAILNNSKFYRIIMPTSLFMAFSVIYFNKYFYNHLNWGIEGLAFATFITVTLASVFKLWFVKAKLNMSPFTSTTFKMIGIIIVLFMAFNFWNFNIPEFYIGKLPIHPIINIILKSILIVSVYLFIVVKLNISPQINGVIKRFVKR